MSQICADLVLATKVSFTSCCSYAYRFAAAPWLEFQQCSILWCFNGDRSKIVESFQTNITHTMYVWYIYLHLVDFHGKRRYKYIYIQSHGSYGVFANKNKSSRPP